MRLYKKRLRLVIRNTSDSKIAFHLIYIPVKFCTKRSIFYIMDRTAELSVSIRSHSASSRSEVRMIVHAVK